MPELDEQSLIIAAQKDPQYFGQFYLHYVERIFAFAYRQTGCRELAQDITANTFEKALAHLGSYRWQGCSSAAWLYKIALNEVRKNYWKQRLLRPLRESDVSPVDVEHAVQVNEQTRILLAAMNNLSTTDCQVLTLRFFEDLSSADVAQVLGCSLPNVYLRLHRALERLRKHMVCHEVEGVAYVSK